ncbi:MAG: hypothetical protein AAGI30_02200 [Planctomycetota bacterium]
MAKSYSTIIRDIEVKCDLSADDWLWTIRTCASLVHEIWGNQQRYDILDIVPDTIKEDVRFIIGSEAELDSVPLGQAARSRYSHELRDQYEQLLNISFRRDKKNTLLAIRSIKEALRVKLSNETEGVDGSVGH